MNKLNPLSYDLDHILNQTISLWEKLRNQRIFITGGTGFFGCWLLESFVWANEKLKLNAKMVVLTRNANSFAKKCPHLVEQSALQFLAGDVRDFAFPEGKFSFVIHAATDASAAQSGVNPLQMLDTMLAGTQHILEFAKSSEAKNFLLVSSGAVYGKQPADVTHLTEDHDSKLNFIDTTSVYAVGKCVAEHLSCLYAKQHGLNVKIARCFAFVGPYLSLDGHFALANFIRDGLNGKTILVNGDGTAYRSYLYAADLAIWLWTVLFKGETLRPYNVGSSEPVSISELASRVAENFSATVKIEKKLDKESKPERYVPNTDRAQNELGLTQKIGLDQALQATIKWYKSF